METTKTNLGTDETVAVNEEAKKIAVISYVTLIGLVIAFVMNNEKKLPFASYHLRQSLGLCATGLALGVIGIVPILGWVINIIGIFVLLYMWIMGLMHAINQKEKPVPFLGEKYEAWFKSI